MPSFGQLMIDDYLRASQNLQQVTHQATATAASMNANESNQMNQAIANVNDSTARVGAQQQQQRQFDVNEAQQNQQFEQQRQDRYQQLLIHHEEQMNRKQDEENRRIGATARLWGRAQAEQNKPWDTTKVNPAWPDEVKEQALIGYEEGKGKLALINTRSDVSEARQIKLEGMKQQNRKDIASYRAGQSVAADLAKWKQKGGDLRLQLAPLFIEMTATKNMRRTDARETIANVLRKAGVVEQQVQQKLNEMDSQVNSGSVQQRPVSPSQQPVQSQSEDQLDEFGFPKFK